MYNFRHCACFGML